MFLTSDEAPSRGFGDKVLDSGAGRLESCAKSDAMKEREVGGLVVIGYERVTEKWPCR